jgi:hypothetical protein
MGKEDGIAFRRVVEAFVANDANTTLVAVRSAREAMQLEEKSRLKIESMPLLKSQVALTSQLNQAAAEFDQYAGMMLGRVRSNSSADAERDVILHLSQSTDRYSDAVQRLADFVERQTASISGVYTKANNGRLALLIGFAGWPLLLAAVIILVTGAGAVIMLLVFRQVDDVGDAAK